MVTVTTPLFEVISGEPKNELAMFEHMFEIGRTYGVEADVLVRHGSGSSQELPPHSETLHLPADAMCRFVLLGCIRAARSGGETVVYDGQTAANIVADIAPELSALRIEYRSPHYRDLSATHTLTARSDVRTQPFLFRSRDKSNIVQIDTLPDGMTENEAYDIAESAVRQSACFEHEWREGDVLVVNNQLTLHSRNPYEGDRSLMRMRVY